MTIDEANQKILIHAGFALDTKQPGFLRQLRPYAGLNVDEYADLVHCLVTIHPTVSQSPHVERTLAAALWTICERTRVLIADNGSLRTNKLISESDLQHLAAWTDSCELFALRMLSGLELADCISHVLQYLATHGQRHAAKFRFLLPLVASLCQHQDQDIQELAKITHAHLLQKPQK